MILGLLAHLTPSIFFSRFLRSEALVYNSYFFRTAILRKLFDIRFSYKHCNFSRFCLLVKMASKTVTRSIESFLCKLLPSPMDEYKNGTGTWHGDGVTGVLGLGGHVYTWVIGNMGFEKIKLRVVFSRFWSILPLYFLETRRYKLCHLGLPYKKFKWENFTWEITVFNSPCRDAS